MVMKWINSTLDEDLNKGIDYWLQRGDAKIPILCRERYISINKFRDISIRYPTEYQKFLDNQVEALLYIFSFTDAIVVCLTSDIANYLKSIAQPTTYSNDDGTQGCYIPINNIPHLLIHTNREG